jgi:hypothetical protein
MQSLIGIWQLIETHAFDEAGRERPSPFGPQPVGVVIIGAERMMAMGSDERTTLPQEAEPTFVAYCGKYNLRRHEARNTRRRGIEHGPIERSGPVYSRGRDGVKSGMASSQIR